MEILYTLLQSHCGTSEFFVVLFLSLITIFFKVKSKLYIWFDKATHIHRQRFFAYFAYTMGVEPYNIAMAKFKNEMMHMMEATLEEVPGDVLEIGCGSGSNLEFFPTGTSHIALDPNPFMEQYYKANLALRPDLHLRSYMVCGAEDLSVLSDNSVSVVVSTLVLCSVEDITKVLQEIQRVLKPGGRFLFMEHVIAPKGTWRWYFQWLVNDLSIFIMSGCDCRCETWKPLDQAGFPRLKYEYMVCQTGIYHVDPHVIGYAEI